MERMLQMIDIPNTRISAIDGKTEDVMKYIHCIDSKAINDGQPVTEYEIACCLSHLRAIHSLKTLSGEYFLVLEDDVSFENMKYIPFDLETIVKGCPPFDILQLHKITQGIPLNTMYTKWGKGLSGTACYIVSRNGVRTITDKFRFEKDILQNKLSEINVADITLYEDFTMFTYLFNIASTLNTHSTIHSDHIEYHKTSTHRERQRIFTYFKIPTIPNTITFVFALKPQTEEFLFCYYLSVYSAYILNKPDKIVFYYHYDLYGKWFDALQQIACIEFRKVDLPTHIGGKPLRKVAHMADKLRMDILYEHGGVYMDIDTISIRPYTHLLWNETVLGFQSCDRICNAIMMTIPKSDFFAKWLQLYEDRFEPDGWEESSILLQFELYTQYPNSVTVVPEETFFRPSYDETDQIFVTSKDIPNDLLTLHLWETHSMKYMNDIHDWSWARQNSHTLYGKMLLQLLERSGQHKEDSRKQERIHKRRQERRNERIQNRTLPLSG